jgi:hypothetical protein
VSAARTELSRERDGLCDIRLRPMTSVEPAKTVRCLPLSDAATRWRFEHVSCTGPPQVHHELAPTLGVQDGSITSLRQGCMLHKTRQAMRSPAPAMTSGRAVIVLVLLATACSNDTPTQPSAKLAPTATLAITPAVRTAAGALLEDAAGRLIPSLSEATSRAKLRGHLDDLSAALEADNVAKARRQIALARRMIAALADSPDAADLAVVGIALDQVEAQLDAASAIQGEP